MPGKGVNTSSKRRFRGTMSSGGTFAIVELLDPTDAICFKRIMRRQGFRDLTPYVRGHTFRSSKPTEDWMRKVAMLDPDWWYLSGHSGRTAYYDPEQDETYPIGDFSFFNKPYYDNEWETGRYDPKREVYGWTRINRNSMRIRIEYVESRSDLKKDSFFERFGKRSYLHAKVVLAVGCNTLVFPSVRKYLSQLFPLAVILGHIHKNPANATPIIRHFLRRYFSRPDKAYDWYHIVTSWLSYHDIAKSSIMKRAYGLAALYKGNVWGIDLDKTWGVLGQRGEAIERYRLKSILREGRKVDSLIIRTPLPDGKERLESHEWKYEGDENIISQNQVELEIGDDKDKWRAFSRVLPEYGDNLRRYRGY